MFILFVAVSIIGCKNFDRVKVEDQPDECKDFYYVLEYYSVEGKDSAFVGTVYNECKQARKDKKKNDIEISKRDKKIKSLCEKIYGKDIKMYEKCIKE